MRGQILGTDAARGVGVLLDAGGDRLEFPLSEWRSAGAPVVGQWVDYLATDGQAREIYAMPAGGAPGAPQAGRASLGTVLGAISVGCLLLGFAVPIVLPHIAALVLGIVGARRAQEDGDEAGLVLSRIGWIGGAVLLTMGALLILALLLFFGGLMGIAGAFHWLPFADWT